MNKETAIKVFSKWDKQGRFVFTRGDLAKLFPEDKNKTLQEGVNRLVRNGLLTRAARGVYVYTLAHSTDSYMIERIAMTLRRGEYNYISLESALSSYGLISQIPIDRLTVMTTGRSGSCQTPWGIVEFTHTARSIDDIIENTYKAAGPLRLASAASAWRDLKRVGRNTQLVDQQAVADV